MADYLTAQGKTPAFVAIKAEYTNHPVLGRILKVTHTANGFSAPKTLFREILPAKPSYTELRERLAEAGFKLTGNWRQTAGSTLVAKAEAI